MSSTSTSSTSSHSEGEAVISIRWNCHYKCSSGQQELSNFATTLESTSKMQNLRGPWGLCHPQDVHDLGGVQLARHGAKLLDRKPDKEGGSMGRSSSNDNSQDSRDNSQGQVTVQIIQNECTMLKS